MIWWMENGVGKAVPGLAMRGRGEGQLAGLGSATGLGGHIATADVPAEQSVPRQGRKKGRKKDVEGDYRERNSEHVNKTN
jgi:hypothetical protein